MMIGPGAQFSLTYATELHPGQDAQMLHYEQGIYPLPRDRDVMVTAIWALDDFAIGNGATRVVPGSHRRAEGEPSAGEAVPAEMTAGLRVYQRQAPPRMARERSPRRRPVTQQVLRGAAARLTSAS
jgi:Phytanoyl-CoA dioxygenase (PhyH)